MRNKFWLILLAIGLVFLGCAKEEATPAETASTEMTEEAVMEPAEPVSTVSLAQEVMSYFAEMPSHSRMIGQQDVVDMLAAGDSPFILDIRAADAYAAGHLKGAVNLPWGAALGEALSYLPQDEEVLIYCYTGQTANQANAVLNVAGITTRSIKFGWNFGLSKVEGIEAVTETAVNELNMSSMNEVDPVLSEAAYEYFTGLADVAGTTFASNIVSEANAKAIHDAGADDVLFLSIRKAADYDAGHIEGAINIPWGSGMNDQFDTLPMDKKIIVNCYTGQTAGQAVAGLRLLGFDAVSLKGGMGTGSNVPQGWANNEYPVVPTE